MGKGRKMKLANGEVFMAWDAIDKLMQEKLPVRVGMGLAKIRTVLFPAYKEISEVRDSLIKVHGDDLPNGQKGLTTPNNPDGKPASPGWDAFVEANAILMNTERDEDFTISKVKLPEIEIEGTVILALEKFIEV